jgi:two-component system, sensor histidine kinase and response regulator
MKILIVDDDEDIRDSLADFFSDAGFEVRLAANGAEAWDALNRDTPPCAMILDLIMPVLDGNGLYERVRNDERLRDLPIIIATSDPTRAPAGVTTMTKPMDLDRLLVMVKTNCSRTPR